MPVVACFLRIEDCSRGGGIEIIGREICEIAGELRSLARLLRIDREDETVDLHGGDLAILDALHRKPRISDDASVPRRSTQLPGPSKAGGRDRRRRDTCELLDCGSAED